MFSYNLFSSIGNLKPYAILENGKIPASQLPGYVDDVLEFADIHGLPVVGETGKIYVTIDNGKCWRWSGSAFIEISPTTTHKSTHATGGTDALTPEDIGAAPASDINPDVAVSAGGLYDFANGSVALKIDDSGVFLAGEQFDLGTAPDVPTALKQNFRAALGLGNVQNTADLHKPISSDGQLALSAKSPLSIFIRLSGCPDTNFNALYTYAGIFEGEPKYYAATGESLTFNSEEWVVETAEQVTKYFNTRTDLDPSTLTSGWKQVVGAASSLPVSIIVERVSPVPNKNTLADPVVQAATGLRTEESNDVTALIYSVEDDSWHIHDADNFRVAIGAATAEQGAKADTALQPTTTPADLGAVGSNTTAAQGGTQLLNMVQITQAAYSAIVTPTANTLYIIVG